MHTKVTQRETARQRVARRMAAIAIERRLAAQFAPLPILDSGFYNDDEPSEIERAAFSARSAFSERNFRCNHSDDCDEQFARAQSPRHWVGD